MCIQRLAQCAVYSVFDGDDSNGGSMKVGSLVVYKNRYVGQQFVVIAVREGNKPWSKEEKQAQCVSIQTGVKTRWSSVSTFLILA